MDAPNLAKKPHDGIEMQQNTQQQLKQESSECIEIGKIIKTEKRNCIF